MTEDVKPAVIYDLSVMPKMSTIPITVSTALYIINTHPVTNQKTVLHFLGDKQMQLT